MAYEIPFTAESVGSLTPVEAVAFSQPHPYNFTHARELGLFDNVGNITLLDPRANDNEFGVPRGYEQFLPAIAMIMRHELERRARSELVLAAAILTTRQWTVKEGDTQQGPPAYLVHRDTSGKDFPSVFYTISDCHPTEYFPGIASTPEMPNEISLLQPAYSGAECVSFAPYEVVYAPSTMYHRSPEVDRSTIRTFLRVIFNYF